MADSVAQDVPRPVPYTLRNPDIFPLVSRDSLNYREPSTLQAQINEIYPRLNAKQSSPDLDAQWQVRSKDNRTFRNNYAKARANAIELEGVEFRLVGEGDDYLHFAVCVDAKASSKHRTWPLYDKKSLIDLADDLLAPHLNGLAESGSKRYKTWPSKTRYYVFAAKKITFSPVGGALATPLVTLTNELCIFDGCTFAGIFAYEGRHITFEKCVFIDCKFTPFQQKLLAIESGARRAVRVASILNTEFLNCDLAGTSFDGVQFNNVTFEVCDLSNVNFANTTCTPSVRMRDPSDKKKTERIRLMPIKRANADDSDLEFSEEELEAYDEEQRAKQDGRNAQQELEQALAQQPFSVDTRIEHFFKVTAPLAPRLLMEYCYFSQTQSQNGDDAESHHALVEGFFENVEPTYNLKTHYVDTVPDYGALLSDDPRDYIVANEELRAANKASGKLEPILPAIYIVYDHLIKSIGGQFENLFMSYQLRPHDVQELAEVIAFKYAIKRDIANPVEKRNNSSRRQSRRKHERTQRTHWW